MTTPTPQQVDAATIDVRVTIAPMHPWYRMTGQGHTLDLVDMDGDPECRSTEHLTRESLAAELERQLHHRNLDAMWWVTGVTALPLADAPAAEPQPELKAADGAFAGGFALRVVTDGVRSMRDAVTEATGATITPGELHAMVARAIAKAEAEPNGPELVRHMLAAAIARTL